LASLEKTEAWIAEVAENDRRERGEKQNAFIGLSLLKLLPRFHH
jgi:hypothetical protein